MSLKDLLLFWIQRQIFRLSPSGTWAQNNPRFESNTYIVTLNSFGHDWNDHDCTLNLVNWTCHISWNPTVSYSLRKIHINTTSLHWIKLEIAPFLVKRHYNPSVEIKSSMTWPLSCMENNWSHRNCLWNVCVCARTYVHVYVWVLKCLFCSWNIVATDTATGNSQLWY